MTRKQHLMGTVDLTTLHWSATVQDQERQEQIRGRVKMELLMAGNRTVRPFELPSVEDVERAAALGAATLMNMGVIGAH